MTPEQAAAEWLAALHAQDDTAGRSEQSALGILGVSDVGTCRERARRIVTGMPATDNPKGLAAWIGTAIDERAAQARAAQRPSLIQHAEVTVELPAGFVLPGHPDEIDPDEPSVTDLKTVDGLGMVRSAGASQQQRFQRHLYALGAIQAGLIPAEGVTVRNVWLDRSGKDRELHVEQEPFSADVVAEASMWLEDVEYAARNGEEASKDMPSSWCRVCCPFFTACRGGQTVAGERITDGRLIEAARLYDAATSAEREYKSLAAAARSELADVNGVAGDLLVSWTTVNRVNGSYQKISVTPVAATASDAA